MSFQKASPGAKARNKGDAVGSILITVSRYDNETGKGHTKGNITRRMTVGGGRVSTVAAAIEKALFGGKGR